MNEKRSIVHTDDGSGAIGSTTAAGLARLVDIRPASWVQRQEARDGATGRGILIFVALLFVSG